MDTFFDELGLDDETPSERLARELAEADIDLINTLRCIREQQGLSQAGLGDLLGISQATVSAFESGEADAKLSTIRRYAHALKVMVSHSVRPLDGSMPKGFVWTSFPVPVPVGRLVTDTHTYAVVNAVANSKRTDFALGA